MARRLVPMEPGERDRLITLVPITGSRGSSGFPVETDAAAEAGIDLFASKQDVGGRERFAAHQATAPYDTRWEVPYRADIDPDLVDVPRTFALRYQGRRFDIVAASMIGRKEGVELLTLARMG